MNMKKMKLVSCLMAMTISAMALCSAVSAADGTVQVNVGNDTQAAGADFSVDVSLASVPSGGLTTIDLAIDYDDAILSIKDVKLGTVGNTGAASSEGELGDTLFTWKDTGDQIALVWATGVTDTSKWIKSNGVFVTITGTIKSDAAPGSSSPLTVTAVDRETYPNSGTSMSDIVISAVGESSTATYDCKATNGSVTVAGGLEDRLWGDVNCDGVVKIDDVVMLNRFIAEDAEVSLEGRANADCAYTESLDSDDSAAILQYLAGLLTKDQLGPQK